MITPESIAQNFSKTFSADGSGDNYSRDHFSGLTLGVVVDTDDPLQTGRLRVFCPALNDSPKKVQHLPWSSYVSPFSGSITNSQYFRGMDDENATSNGSLHYGFWAIPEMGAHVLVGCIDGDPRRRFWIGCIPEHQQTNTIHHGRYKWNDGEVEGPLTGANAPMQPLYDNMRTAFGGRANSPEFRSRVAEYQASAVNEDVGQIPNSKLRDTLDQQNSQIIANNPDTWEHAAMGAHGYDWSGFKALGGIMSSRVFGWSTPGMHSFTMDDRPFNSRMRLRTTAGHQILMDDTNERIYIATFNGKNYIEMDVSGNIDCYSENRISLHSEKDINFSAGKTLRLFANEGIHLYAGNLNVNHDTDSYQDDTKILQAPLDSPPVPGEIRIHATADLHMKSEENIRQLSMQDTYQESNGNFWGKTDKSFYQQTADNMNVSTDSGAYNMSVATDINETAGRDSKRFSEGQSSVASNGKNEVLSFQGTTEVGAQSGVNLKTSTGNVSVESQGNDGGGGSIEMKTPNNQIEVGDDGVKVSCGTVINIEAAFGVTFSVDSGVANKVKTPLPMDKLPNDVGQNPNPSLPPEDVGFIPWDDYTDPEAPPTVNTCRQSITIDEMVQIAYAAGFRGRDLIVAVATAMAESELMVLSSNRSDGQYDVFEETVGLFQIRTFKDPDNCGAPPYRDNRNRQLENPNRNVEAAYEIFMNEEPRGVWTDSKWPSIGNGGTEANLQAATDAVERWSDTNMSVGSDIVSGINSLLSSFNNAYAQAIAMLSPPESLLRLINQIEIFQGRLSTIQGAIAGELPLSYLLGSLGIDLGPFQNRVLFMLDSPIAALLPPGLTSALNALSGNITSVQNLLSSIPSLPSAFGKSMFKMDNRTMDLQSMMDINLRSITMPILNVSTASFVTQFNITVAAVTAIINYLPISPPIPSIPLGPLSALVKTAIPSLSLPPFSDDLVGQIFRNNSLGAAKDMLSQIANQRTEGFASKLKDQVTERVKAITGGNDG